MSIANTLKVIGFVGIGNMGKPMAKNLLNAGFDVIVYDTSLNLCTEFVAEIGGSHSDSLANLAARSDAVITMLPTGEIVRAVTLGNGDGGDYLVDGFRPGAILIDMSSSAPVGTKELSVALAEKNISLVDAPVSGGVPRAVTGMLAIIAGGDAEVVERCEPLFAAMGNSIRVGDVGSGHAAKLLNNLVSAAGLAAAAEAVVVGERFGIDPEKLIDVFNASTGRNNATDVKFKQFILNQKFNSGFSMALMVKDLTLALQLADQCEVPTDVGHACLDSWREALGSLEIDADHTEIARHAGRIK